MLAATHATEIKFANIFQNDFFKKSCCLPNIDLKKNNFFLPDILTGLVIFGALFCAEL